LRSATLGQRVLLVEKEAQIGGTGRGSAYGIWIPQNRLLRDMGIMEDEARCLRWMCKHAYPEQYDANKVFNGIPEIDYRQFETYFSCAGEAVDFLEQASGVELVFMRNHAGDKDTYAANKALMQLKGLPDEPELLRALPDYHPEDEDNDVPVGRYVNFKTNFASIMLYFLFMFRFMSFKVLLSGLVEMMVPKVLWQVAKGFLTKNDEGAFSYCGAGLRMTKVFRQLLAKQNVEMLTLHSLEEVLFDAAGAVSGVKLSANGIESSYQTKNVIITVGGFAHNKAMLKQYAPDFPVQRCASRPSSDGMVLQGLAERVQLGHMSDIWQTESLLELALQPQAAGDIIGSSHVWHLNGDSAIVVDQHGLRCYDESKQYSMRSKWYRSEGKEVALYIFDKRTVQRFGGLLGTWSAHLPYLTAVPGLRPSYIVEGKTIDELTVNLQAYLHPFQQHVDCHLSDDFSANVKMSIQRFNGFAKIGIDEDFGRGASLTGMGWRAKRAKDNHYPNKTMFPMADEGPYYAMALCLSCFNTKGGLQTDHNAQVLDKTHQPIPGLYAAGNCAASASNTGYVLSTIGPALTFGFVAANHIAETA
ncbi:MAG: FAD-binding protein, partial [Pseudomonadales bacterium]|nr:FAD-binding protein [Pseudomonadales bacterium]